MDNTATATGTLPGNGGTTVSPPDSTSTPIAQTPAISATKTATLTTDNGVPALADEGEVATNDGGCQIECWLHGSMFDLRTGKPTNFPATEPVATFPIDVRGGDVYVDTDTTLNGVTPA